MKSRFLPKAAAAVFLFSVFFTPLAGEERSKQAVSDWLTAHAQDYRQKYTLSCEIALIRLSLAVAGIRDLTEDAILAGIPKGIDPETSFVCDDINAGRKNPDGSIRWNNYGTHAPVVARSINAYLESAGLQDGWEARVLAADDSRLRGLVGDDPAFRGAVVWVVGHPERWGANPPVNERGMVLGEHVRFIEPTAGANGSFRIFDPETGTVSEAETAGAARNLFSYRIVGLFATAPEEGKIARGAPGGQSRTGVMLSLGNDIRSFISSKNDSGKILLLALLALAYGVLHALGPGHQKTLVSGYLLSEGGGLKAAVGASGIAAASHAVSVITLFAVLALLGSGLGVMDVTNAGKLVTLVSGILLVALALVMVFRRITNLIDDIRGTNREHDGCDCGHDHHTDRDHGAGIAHGRHTAKKGAIPLLVSGSLSPCPGAALFLLYGFHEGNALAGVVAVIAISIGMWLTLIFVALATVALRAAGIASSGHRKSRLTRYLPAIFGVCGSCAVLAFAVLTAIPS